MVGLSSSTESGPGIPGPAIQKQAMVKSLDQPKCKRRHLLSPILNTRGCPWVYYSPKYKYSGQWGECPVQCHLWPLNFVQMDTHLSEVS